MISRPEISSNGVSMLPKFEFSILPPPFFYSKSGAGSKSLILKI